MIFLIFVSLILPVFSLQTKVEILYFIKIVSSTSDFCTFLSSRKDIFLQVKILNSASNVIWKNIILVMFLNTDLTFNLLQEEVKNFITLENLDQRIEEALDNPKNYNFAINKKGSVIKQTMLQ